MPYQARNIPELVNDLLDISEEFITAEHAHARLGKSLRDMLAIASDFCRDQMWHHAMEVCDKGSDGLLKFTMDYVGSSPMDIQYGLGTINYFVATALVGDNRLEEAIRHFSDCCVKFKDATTNKIAAPAVWLAIAEVRSYRKEFSQALWALQRGRNLLDGHSTTIAEKLLKLIGEEYEQARQDFQKQLRETPSNPRPTGQKKARDEHRHTLLTFPIFGNLAAGKAVWMAESSMIEDYVEVERLSIKGKPYRILNLKNEGTTVPLESSKLYGVAQVKGNSMNRIESKLTEPRVIDDGDYVLLVVSRGGRYAARDGDIVAAVIPDAAGDNGVVKRYRISMGEEVLMSESIDPMEKNISMEQAHAEIFAEVIAVLKPDAEKM